MKPIDEKISAFVKRYVKATPSEDLEAACERNLARLLTTVEAMKEKARRERTIERLSLFEYLFLTAAHILGGDSDSVMILHKITELSGKQPNLSAVLATLSRMLERGLIKTRWSEPLPERGGRRRYFVAVTDKGRQALADAGEYLETAPDFLRDWI